MIIDDDNVMVVGKPTIGFKMKRVREIHGIKQEVLGRKIGVSQQTISDWENSDMIHKSSLQKFADGLGVAVDEIVNFEEKAVMQFFNCTHTGGTVANGTINNTSPELIALLEKLLDELKNK